MTKQNSDIVVFVKEPIPGHVKTRLNKKLDPFISCSLYKAFVEDFLSALKDMRNARITIACKGRVQHVQDWIGDQKFYFVSQGRGDLGDRMLRLFKHVFSKGAKRCIILGSDSPTLPISFINTALRALIRKDIVIGPAWDGGFYLIGVRQVPPKGIFRNVSWSKSYTLKQLIFQIKEHGMALKLLHPWYDIDDVKGLDLLKTHLFAIQYATGLKHKKTWSVISQLASKKRNHLKKRNRRSLHV